MTPRVSLSAGLLALVAAPAFGADILADSVSENFSVPLNGGGACPADVTVLSDGNINVQGYCPLLPISAAYTITFDFSPATGERMTGLRIWSNAGNVYSDAELRIFDLAVEYLDANGVPQTLNLNDVDIGDTANSGDAKFVAFTGVDPDGLRGVTQIRMSDLQGRSGDNRVEFREVNAVVVTPPTVVLGANAPAPGDPYTITATFSEDVTDVDLADFAVANALLSNLVQVSQSVYTFTATPTASASASGVLLSLPAGGVTDLDDGVTNTASGTLNLTVSGALPPSSSIVLDDTIRAEELKSLRQRLDRAEAMSRGARDRLARANHCRDIEEDENAPLEELEACHRERVALDQGLATDGVVEVSEASAQVAGTLSRKFASPDGTRRRLFFGEFDVTDDSDLGLIATLSGQVAWEYLVGRDALWGYFLGAEASLSDVPGQYTGDRERLGVSGGVYGARDLQNGLMADGFAVLGYGLNTLSLTDGALNIDADYQAPSVLLGAALSGERAYDTFALHPEMALAMGYSEIGTVDYDAGGGPASTEPGHVALARLTLTPEMRLPWDVPTEMYDGGTFSIAPRLICEWVDSGDSDSACGAGLDFALSARSLSGLHALSGKIGVEDVGGSTRKSLTLSLESKF